MKRTLLSLAVAMAATTLYTNAALAGDTCLYVVGTVEGKTVTTPAVLIPIADTGVTVDPINVHVDPTTQTILGYSVSTPGVDYTTNSYTVFVPGRTVDIPSYSATLNDVVVNSMTCVSAGATTPAVPIYIPASQLTVPGFFVWTPYISLNAAGQYTTLPGQYINFAGYTLVIPAYSTTIPPRTIATPDKTLTVNINNVLKQALYMLPPN